MTVRVHGYEPVSALHTVNPTMEGSFVAFRGIVVKASKVALVACGSGYEPCSLHVGTGDQLGCIDVQTSLLQPWRKIVLQEVSAPEDPVHVVIAWCPEPSLKLTSSEGWNSWGGGGAIPKAGTRKSRYKRANVRLLAGLPTMDASAAAYTSSCVEGQPAQTSL